MTTNAEAVMPSPAVNHSDADPSHLPNEPRNVIQETKERAKAVMAASGIDVASKPAENGDVSERPSSSSSSRDRLPNGKPASPRKRSRSGSRIPNPPPVDENSRRPIESGLDKYRLLRNIERDDIYAAMISQQCEDQSRLMQQKKDQREVFSQLRQHAFNHPGTVYGPGFQGYGGNPRTEVGRPNRLPLVYPAQHKKPGNRKARRIYIKRKDLNHQADQAEELVPIRLDVEVDRIKLRDTFTWNLHDRVINPEVFAETLVEDFKVPLEQAPMVTQQVIQRMNEQIIEYYPHVFIQDDALDDVLPYFAYKNDEMRILIKLNITIGPHTLVDQFEWEINNPMNSPEEFARHMSRDLSLSGEFTTAIAHQIREQAQMFTRSLYITAHPFDGRPIEDADLRDSFLSTPIVSVFRPAQAAKDFTPYLYELNEVDLQREELSLLRDQRRQKRSVTRRGGPALPDLKDRERTVRSLVVSSVLPGAADTLDEARVYKFSRSSGRTRRAGRAEGGDDSEESESEESELEEVPQALPTTSSRGRVIRNAANAAAVAMRNLGRSATPEVSQVQHHEPPRSSSRRHPLEREESVSSSPSLMVKLTFKTDVFRRWAQNPSKFRLVDRLSASRSNTPQNNRHSMPPPPSPASSSKQHPKSASPAMSSESNGFQYDAEGRVDTGYPPLPNHKTPPPPAWLLDAVNEARQEHPQDSFEAYMKYTIIDTRANSTVPPSSLSGMKETPAWAKFQYQPRIKCNDCPGKAYTGGPGVTIKNFEIHLKNGMHRKRVEARRDGRPPPGP